MQKRWLNFFLLIIISANLLAANLPVYNFPLGNYPQQIDNWLPAKNDTSWLIDAKIQQTKFAELKSHYFGVKSNDQSPWSENFVKKILAGTATKNIYASQLQTVSAFDNSAITESRHIGYGLNYLPYSQQWLTNIATNMQLLQFKQVSYKSSNRAIITSDTTAYAIPTTDPWYLSYTIAGQGFPMNNNTLSSVYLGTPVYVIGKSVDGQWLLLLTPQFVGWVAATNVAYTKPDFIDNWNSLVNKHLTSVIAPHASIMNRYGIILDVASNGTLLPGLAVEDNSTVVQVPLRDAAGNAYFEPGYVRKDSIVSVPLLPTYANFRLLISKLIGRSYGWGGYLGYNDCSSELQAIFTAFGFYMPRNSAQQVNVGKVVDLSDYNSQQRFNYLLNQAAAMVTLVYVPGHIMLYVGNVRYDKQLVPVIYQNIWGMRKSGEDSRYIIGQSVLFPLLPNYKESIDYVSLLSKPIFRVSTLNADTPNYDVSNLLY
jgi:cell wall-associated NlpC family hydrolase